MRKRSKAWIYYAIIGGVAGYFGFDENIKFMVPALLCGAYAVYLYRGGRFVLWIW